MERLHARVHGRVQGVTYRDFTCRKGRGLGLVGTVKNLPDGSVEVIAEGARADLEALLQKLHHGPLFAKVERVEHAFTTASNSFTSFSVLFN